MREEKEVPMRKYLIGMVVFLVAMGGGVGFAKNVEKNNVKEVKVKKANELKKKAQEYWNYKVKRSFYKMYDYECSDVHKKLTRDEYAQVFGKIIMLSEAKVEGVKGESEEKAKVKVLVKGILVPAAQKILLPVYDPWKMENGKWCHIFPVKGKPASLPPTLGKFPPPPTNGRTAPKVPSPSKPSK